MKINTPNMRCIMLEPFLEVSNYFILILFYFFSYLFHTFLRTTVLYTIGGQIFY
jgi:hypothetical protein